MLTAIVSDLCRHDHELGDFVNAAAGQWVLPEGEKERIELQVRAAQLNYCNYRVAHDAETGEEQVEFVCPPDLTAEIRDFDQSKRRARQILGLPDNCRGFLTSPAELSQEHVTTIAALMAAAVTDQRR